MASFICRHRTFGVVTAARLDAPQFTVELTHARVMHSSRLDVTRCMYYLCLSYKHCNLIGFHLVADAEAPANGKANILTRLLSISSVPYGSYVPNPEGFMHRTSAEMKQLWTIALLIIVSRSPTSIQLLIPVSVALTTLVALPKRLSRPQILRVATLCAAAFILTLLGADSLPPVLSDRAPPISVDGTALTSDGLPASLAGAGGSRNYRYVLLNLGLITVTKRSVSLAVTLAALTFTALQAASLCLITTPPERIAIALGRALAPLRLIGLGGFIKELTLTVLLALRFTATVFEESRNLCLGLASRGIDWGGLGFRGVVLLILTSITQLFHNLMMRSGNIAQAMSARGFIGPKHRLYIPDGPKFCGNWEDIMLLSFLGCVVVGAHLLG